MNVLRDSKRPVQWLENEIIAKRFPMLNYSEGWGAAFGCVKSFESQGEQGVAIEMRTHDSNITDIRFFDRAVVCAGPWTTKLVPRLKAHLSSLLTAAIGSRQNPTLKK
jgi:hypothetical protein